MKQTQKTIIRNVKSIKGNSLAEFATTTALMATLAATAAPKLSEMSEGTKAEKSRNEIDRLSSRLDNSTRIQLTKKVVDVSLTKLNSTKVLVALQQEAMITMVVLLQKLLLHKLIH